MESEEYVRGKKAYNKKWELNSERYTELSKEIAEYEDKMSDWIDQQKLDDEEEGEEYRKLYDTLDMMYMDLKKTNLSRMGKRARGFVNR